MTLSFFPFSVKFVEFHSLNFNTLIYPRITFHRFKIGSTHPNVSEIGVYFFFFLCSFVSFTHSLHFLYIFFHLNLLRIFSCFGIFSAEWPKKRCWSFRARHANCSKILWFDLSMYEIRFLVCFDFALDWSDIWLITARIQKLTLASVCFSEKIANWREKVSKNNDIDWENKKVEWFQLEIGWLLIPTFVSHSIKLISKNCSWFLFVWFHSFVIHGLCLCVFYLFCFFSFLSCFVKRWGE